MNRKLLGFITLFVVLVSTARYFYVLSWKSTPAPFPGMDSYIVSAKHTFDDYESTFWVYDMPVAKFKPLRQSLTSNPDFHPAQNLKTNYHHVIAGREGFFPRYSPYIHAGEFQVCDSLFVLKSFNRVVWEERKGAATVKIYIITGYTNGMGVNGCGASAMQKMLNATKTTKVK